MSLRSRTSARKVDRSPHPSRMRIQSSTAPPYAAAQSAGSGSSPRGAVRRPQQRVQLVPLDLVGDERRDQVVEVGGRRQQHRHRPVVAVEPAAPAGGRLDRVPILDPAEARAVEDLRLLAHDDHRRLPHAGRQPPHRVHEGAEVDVVGRGERVQARVHRPVRRLEHAQQRLARGPQQRRVGAVVELDLVGDQPGRLSQRPTGNGGRDAQTGDGHQRPNLAASRGEAKRAVWGVKKTERLDDAVAWPGDGPPSCCSLPGSSSGAARRPSRRRGPRPRPRSAARRTGAR